MFSYACPLYKNDKALHRSGIGKSEIVAFIPHLGTKGEYDWNNLCGLMCIVQYKIKQQVYFVFDANTQFKEAKFTRLIMTKALV